MIQRIQSVYLFLSSLALGGLHFLPLGAGNKTATGILSDSVFDIHDNAVLLGASVVAAVIFFISIFLFKNRKTQSLVVTGGIFSVGIIMGVLAMAYFQNKEVLSESNDFTFSLGIGLPIVALVFAFLGRSGITKDDQIVKSMDRLR